MHIDYNLISEKISQDEWKLAYNLAKEPGWPAYVNPTSITSTPFDEYPKDIAEKIINVFYSFTSKKIFSTGSIKVFYENALYGGGIIQSSYYLDIIRSRYKDRIFKKCYEWCSGPGFIGFSLLGNKLCNSVCFSDIYKPAIDCVKDSIKYNNCTGTAYLGGELSCLPDYEIFDLVVANPPHFENPAYFHSTDKHGMRINVDLNWQAHKNFFNNIKNHLAHDGVILLQENKHGSSLDTFLPFIKDSELTVTGIFPNKEYSIDDVGLYYIELTHAT